MFQLYSHVSKGLLLLIACAAAAVDEQACHCESRGNPWPCCCLCCCLHFPGVTSPLCNDRHTWQAGQTLHSRAATATAPCALLQQLTRLDLTVQVVQALHSCFLYDTVSFLDEARFHRLLPLLVAQLAAQPPPAVSALFGTQQTPSAAPELGADLFGDAVVFALVQMAVTANNDALWKSLNHQVCLTQLVVLLPIPMLHVLCLTSP